MKKKVIKIIIILVIVFMFTGCELEESNASLEKETVGTIGKDNVIETQEAEMTELKTTHDIKFNGENIEFTPIYSIEKSRAENLLFTQSSSINLCLSVEDIPEGIDVMVTQVYSDISLFSKQAKYNGIRQDSINIDYHSLPTGGISIRKTDAYIMPFQVEAVDKSETFFRVYNGYGSSYTTRITESELGTSVQGAVLNVVWTILIKEELTGKLYMKTINDRVGIPYNRVPANNN